MECIQFIVDRVNGWLVKCCCCFCRLHAFVAANKHLMQHVLLAVYQFFVVVAAAAEYLQKGVAIKSVKRGNKTPSRNEKPMH